MSVKKQVPCSTCGAIGYLGESCEFCGNLILTDTPLQSCGNNQLSVVKRNYVLRPEFSIGVPASKEIIVCSENDSNKKGAISSDGSLILPFSFDSIIIYNQYERCICKDKDSYSIFDLNGTLLLSSQNAYNIERPLSNTFFVVSQNIGGTFRFGLLDLTSHEFSIPIEFMSIEDANEGKYVAKKVSESGAKNNIIKHLIFSIEDGEISIISETVHAYHKDQNEGWDGCIIFIISILVFVCLVIWLLLT